MFFWENKLMGSIIPLKSPFFLMFAGRVFETVVLGTMNLSLKSRKVFQWVMKFFVAFSTLSWWGPPRRSPRISWPDSMRSWDGWGTTSRMASLQPELVRVVNLSGIFTDTWWKKRNEHFSSLLMCTIVFVQFIHLKLESKPNHHCQVQLDCHGKNGFKSISCLADVTWVVILQLWLWYW